MDINKIWQSRWFGGAIMALAALIIFLLGFKSGEFVGFRKASFSYRWGENYHRNFGGPPKGFFQNFKDRGGEFMVAHGVFGRIMTVGSSTVAIKGRDGVERVVAATSTTVVRSLRDAIKFSELKVGDEVVVVGNPNEAGQIEAELIRLMPPGPLLPSSDRRPLPEPSPFSPIKRAK